LILVHVRRGGDSSIGRYDGAVVTTLGSYGGCGGNDGVEEPVVETMVWRVSGQVSPDK
jgi:hypothetical protein